MIWKILDGTAAACLAMLCFAVTGAIVGLIVKALSGMFGWGL